MREVMARLNEMADPEKAKFLQRFFKTGPGQYAEGDLFLGIPVPPLRRLAREFDGLPEKDVISLLRSAEHEARLLALLILVRRYERGDEATRERVCRAYLKNLRFVNNWDLVDSSAPYILGRHLFERDRSVLKELIGSERLWDRRVAVIATFYFIRQEQYDETLRLARACLRDPEDLMHKAVGWMLREIGKRDGIVAKRFLRRHHAVMPRTMLRYAIERLPPAERAAYLKGTIPKERMRGARS